MNYEDYITPVVFGAIFLGLSIIFSSYIQGILEEKDLSSDLFTFSSFLFGLVLTSYSILFGLIPSIRKDFRESETMKGINTYFRICLLILQISIITSLIYFFIDSYIIFMISITVIGVNIGFFVYMIFLINDLFEFISNLSNS